jgi:hypothetical protein
MSKRKQTGAARGSAAKKPALRRHDDTNGAAEAKVVDAKAVERIPVLSGWLPTASEFKPALDALRPQTSLLPDLNAVIAAFADVHPPRWSVSAEWRDGELDRPLGAVFRRFRIRVERYRYRCPDPDPADQRARHLDLPSPAFLLNVLTVQHTRIVADGCCGLNLSPRASSWP